MKRIKLFEEFQLDEEVTNDVSFFSVQHGLTWMLQNELADKDFVDSVLDKIHKNRISIADLEKIMKEEGADGLNLDKYIKAVIYSEKDKDLRELVPTKAIEEMTDDAKEFISKKIKFLRDEGKPENVAQAIAYSYARKKGFKVPEKK